MMGKEYTITFPDGRVEEIRNLKLFCEKHGLNPDAMYKVYSGKWMQYKNYKITKRKTD